MEELLFLLLQVLIDLLGQVVLEILWELGSATYKAMYERPNRNIVVASLGYLLVGVALGAASLFVWPARVFEPGPIPGLSLILSPLGAGLAMHAWGEYRRSRGHVTTSLATFPGGAAFALGTALVRFLWAR